MDLQVIQSKIYNIRGYKVMLDFDLAELYQVETKFLKRAVKRNIERFPEDFMLTLTEKEFANLRCQIGTSSWGGSRYKPFAFTQEGIAMLSGILRSEIAIQVNISIMRAFVAMRQMIVGYEELLKRIEELEESTDAQFSELYKALTQLLSKQVNDANRRPIGYISKE
ncbi:ORF6N domain-containing protein [Odoribacter sp. AF15-53]|uniref:ORF6N domain-containing protein n=1 Tax=Odoribacter sp. AF15-53 TaxID=2292236 RepID=UPI000E4ECED5|nr:ORF6N domain-containing protein [Odoribacter sp. AF15-53]RHR78289.1 ORF6N domain-containing protein [Odoribacter sp. AF15-53]